MVTADALQIEAVFIAPFLMAPILLVLIIYVLVGTGIKRRQRRDLKGEYLKEHGIKDFELEIEDQDIIVETLKSFMERRRRKK
jgi:sortase A